MESEKENTSDSEPPRAPSLNIKQEPDDEFKDYAKDMMKEMLGWYGYDTKVDNREADTPREERYQLATVDDGSSGMGDPPPDCASTDGSETDQMSHDSDNGRQSRNGETALAAKHRNLVSLINKRDAQELLDSTSPIPIIVCAWCQKNGSKLFTLKTASGNKAFCSELCFNQCRRASFKKNKICDFCKHVRPTVNYVEFQEGEVQLQFCSKKCLGQYKMKIFSETIRNANKGSDAVPPLPHEVTDRQILITPDLWLMEGKERNTADVKKLTSDENSEHHHQRHVGERRSSSYRRSSLSAKERFVRDEESIQQAIRESKEMCSSSPSNKTKHSPIKIPVNPVSFSPEHLMRYPPPPPPGGTLPPGHPPRSMNPLLMSSLFGPQMADFDASAHDSHGFVKSSKEKHSRKSLGMSTSSPEASPSSSGTSPNPFGIPAPPPTSSSHLHGASFPQMFNPAMFPFGMPSFSMPPMMPGDPTVPGAPFWPHFNLFGPGPGSFTPSAGFLPQNSGIPPVTVMVPFPVILPVPVPIPIPLPITKEKIEKFFADKKAASKGKSNQSEERMPENTERCVSTPPSSENVCTSPMPHLPQHCVAKGCLECIDCQDKQRAESADLVLHIRRKQAGLNALDSTYSIKRSSTPTASMEQGYSSYALSKKPKLEPTSDNDGAIDLSVDSTTQSREAASKDSHVVSSSDDRMPNKSHEVASRGDPLKMTLKVPRIHIVSAVSDPPLTQQLPLPPTEHAYSLRRSLILDAPAPPKKAPSPFQERPYVRSIPRDMLEAARRRARVRTK